MKFPGKKCLLAFVLTVSGLSAGGAAFAQSNELGRDSGPHISIDTGAGKFEVVYRFEELEKLSGGQFRLHYNPELVRVADLSSCLEGLPPSHRGTFSVCNDIADKGFIQFVVLDLGRNRSVGSDILGAVKFVTVPGRSGPKADFDSSETVWLDDIRLAGDDGTHLKPVSESAESVLIEIKR